MKRSRTPSFTNPFLVWTRLAWKTGEMMLASAQVIHHRTGRMAAAGATPSARDRREFALMGQEKLEAGVESAKAMAAQLMTLTGKLDSFLALKKVETSTEKPTAWVYLGIEKDGKWNPNYFKLTGKPEVGLRAAAGTDVYKRDSKPTFLDSAGDWKLGRIIGVLRPSQAVTFTKLLPIDADSGGSNWWACIQ